MREMPGRTVAVLWRARRNVLLHEQFSGKVFHDNAFDEARYLADALKEAGLSAVLVQWKPEDPGAVFREIRGAEADIVFNVSSTEEVAFCVCYGLKFVGSGLDLVSLDKAARKKIVRYHGVPTPEFLVLKREEELCDVAKIVSELGLSFPLFVKPVAGRASSGITPESIVQDEQGLKRAAQRVITQLGQAALVERYVRGRELSVGIIGNWGGTKTLPVLEVAYTDSPTNTFEHKMGDREKLLCPAQLEGDVEARVREVCLAAYEALGARDFARIDLILEGDSPQFLEINTYPGLTLPEPGRSTHTSYMGLMARTAGLSRGDLVGRILEAAISRYR